MCSAMPPRRAASPLIERNSGIASSTRPEASTMASPICRICGVNVRTSNRMMALAACCIWSMALSIDVIKSLMSLRSNGVMNVRRTAISTSRVMVSASRSRSRTVWQCAGTASPPSSIARSALAPAQITCEWRTNSSKNRSSRGSSAWNQPNMRKILFGRVLRIVRYQSLTAPEGAAHRSCGLSDFLDADYQTLAESAQCGRQCRQLGRMLRIENPADLFLVLADAPTELGFADAGLAECLQDRELRRDIGRYRDRDKPAPARLRPGQRQASRRIRQRRETERLFRHRARVGLIVALGDGLRYVGKTHDDATAVTGLECGTKHKSFHRTSQRPPSDLRGQSNPSVFLIF